MIKSIKIGNLRNSEFIQFFASLIAIVSKSDPEKLGIKEQFDPIIPDHKKVEELHGRSRKSKFTKEKDDLDNERDECIKGISKVIEGYTHHYNTRIREAAETLLAKIEIYGNSIADQNYPTETTSLKGITDAFSAEKVYINALEILSLTKWNQVMKTKNDAFNERHLASIEAEASSDEDKIKTLRKTIGEQYAELKKHINAHFTLTPKSFEQVVAEINALIDENNQLLNRRKGNKNNEEEDEAED